MIRISLSTLNSLLNMQENLYACVNYFKYAHILQGIYYNIQVSMHEYKFEIFLIMQRKNDISKFS